jgi:catechol 2,3-dioxygenase-like lactoylglutathione lyase family enzyme
VIPKATSLNYMPTLPKGVPNQERALMSIELSSAERATLRWPIWIGVVCDDLEKQRRFYRDSLGLSELQAGDGWVWFDFGGRLLELLARSPLPQYDQRRVTFAFEVDDIHAARADLIRRGVEPVTEVEGGPKSLQYWTYFKDGEGNLFELVQRAVP